MALHLLSIDSKDGVLSLDSMIPSGRGSSGEPILCTARDILLEKLCDQWHVRNIIIPKTAHPIHRYNITVHTII